MMPGLAGVAEAMRTVGINLAGPLSASVISGGRSNVTSVITDGATRWVLRTPPLEGRTPSAHDIGREHQVTSALAGTAVPVAAALLYCDDETPLGVPFMVSAFVEGRALRVRSELDELTDAEVRVVVGSLVQALVAIHRVDYVAAGLGSWGRPDSYSERQLRRWTRQWGSVGTPQLTGLADRVTEALRAALPHQRVASVVHGDFRVDNTLLDADGAVAAVVDWELSTIGDPLADVAMMCAYRHPTFDLVVGEPSAWTSPRLPSPEDLAALYEGAGGFPLREWRGHLALAYYKVAVIAAGIDHRHHARGRPVDGHGTAGAAVEPYLELALATLRGR